MVLWHHWMVVTLMYLCLEGWESHEGLANVFYYLQRSYLYTPLSKCYHLHEREKRRAYDERVREVKRACFSPLVFAATGGMGPPATTVFKKLASLLSEKRSINYSRCLYWLRCRLYYSLLRSSVMCLWGHRSTHRGPTTSHIEVANSEGRLESGSRI